MEKKNGFTMIELLAVLVILGIIMAITIPIISYFLRGNSKDYYSKLEQTVASSSQDFFNDYRVNLPKDIGHVKKIGIPSLVAQKYTTDVVGIDKKACDGDVVVQKLASGNYSYTACLKCEKKKDGSYGYVSNSKECGYSEENNNKYTILFDGLGDKTSIRIPQSQNYTIPNAKVYVNGQALANILKPTPSTIDVNILTTYKVYYTFRTLVKELQIKVYDSKKPVVASITGESGGASYTSGTFTNKDVKVTFLATDWTTSSVYGSGVDHFEYQINGGSVQKINATTADNKNYTASINLNTGGTHNISVKAIDKEGNIGDSKTFTVKIDKTAPSGTIKVASTKSDYNALTVKITLSASDNSGGSGVKQMCIRETNTLSSCSWINYALTRNVTLSGSLDGNTRNIYVWFKDGAGNISNVKSTTYKPYLECTQVTMSGWSSCSKVCGLGTKTNTAKDKFTQTACPSKNQTQSCILKDCCSETVIVGYGECNKSCGGGTKPVYRKSTINGQSCNISTETKECNTHSCDPTITQYERSFDLILPVRENVAIGFNQWGEKADQNCRVNSYVDATVITYDNRTLSFGPKTRVTNGLGYYQLMGARLTDDKVIIYGNSKDCDNQSGSIGYQYPAVATIKVEGNTIKTIQTTILNSNDGAWKAAYGFGCKSANLCYASYWYCPNCTGSSYWTGGFRINIDASGYIQKVENVYRGKGYGHYEGDVENRIGKIVSKGNNEQPWLVYFKDGKSIAVYEHAVYRSISTTSWSDLIILRELYEDYEGATRLKDNELLISVKKGMASSKEYTYYMRIYNYDGKSLTLQKEIETDYYFSGLIRLNDNAAIGYGRSYMGEEGYTEFSSNATKTYLFVR